MRYGHEAMGTRQQWMVLLGMLVVLLGTSVVPGHARGGGHGGGHSHHGGGHSHHSFLGPRLGVSIWPYSNPYMDPYGAPPVVVAPPSVYIQPAPPLWYYCDNPQGYYPYVQQCPGGWRQVTPTPP